MSSRALTAAEVRQKARKMIGFKIKDALYRHMMRNGASRKALAVAYVILFKHCFNSGARVSQDDLCLDVGYSKKTIIGATNELNLKKWICKAPGNGSGFATEYLPNWKLAGAELAAAEQAKKAEEGSPMGTPFFDEKGSPPGPLEGSPPGPLEGSPQGSNQYNIISPIRRDNNIISAKAARPGGRALAGSDAGDDPPTWEPLWLVWPRKEWKSKAKAAYAKALSQGADPKAIQAGAERYAAETADWPEERRKYIRGLHTWLADDGWQEQPAPKPKASKAGSKANGKGKGAGKLGAYDRDGDAETFRAGTVERPADMPEHIHIGRRAWHDGYDQFVTVKCFGDDVGDGRVGVHVSSKGEYMKHEDYFVSELELTPSKPAAEPSAETQASPPIKKSGELLVTLPADPPNAPVAPPCVSPAPAKLRSNWDPFRSSSGRPFNGRPLFRLAPKPERDVAQSLAPDEVDFG
jgi:hypothetical protein